MLASGARFAIRGLIPTAAYQERVLALRPRAPVSQLRGQLRDLGLSDINPLSTLIATAQTDAMFAEGWNAFHDYAPLGVFTRLDVDVFGRMTFERRPAEREKDHALRVAVMEAVVDAVRPRPKARGAEAARTLVHEGTQLELVVQRLGLEQTCAGEVVRLLCAHPGSPIACAAAMLGASTRSLQRELAQSGQSFRDLRMAASVSVAAQLLLRDDLTNVEVAELAGFADGAHLSRSLRGSCGMTPTQYRAMRARTLAALDVGQVIGDSMGSPLDEVSAAGFIAAPPGIRSDR